MSTKRLIYLLLVVVIAGASALVGVVVGGMVAYQAMRQALLDQSITPILAPGIIPTSDSSQRQILEINTSKVESTITKAVDQVGRQW